MTKMRETKMDVVHFNESDVIVASSITLSGMGGEGGNSMIHFGKNSYYTTDQSQFYTDFRAATGDPINGETQIYIFGTSTGSADLDDLPTWDTGDYDFLNRTYYWNGTDFRPKQ